MSASVSQLAYLVHDTEGECRRSVLDAFGDAIVTPGGYQILVGIYVRPSTVKTRGGVKLHLTDATTQEDIWQGKVGLVLELGPDCYQPDGFRKFNTRWCKQGDWVLLPPLEGQKLQINDAFCRFVNDDKILGVIPSPHGFL